MDTKWIQRDCHNGTIWQAADIDVFCSLYATGGRTRIPIAALSFYHLAKELRFSWRLLLAVISNAASRLVSCVYLWRCLSVYVRTASSHFKSDLTKLHTQVHTGPRRN